ncbi:TetR/AcrR family transcriptional regulator [Nocardia sp. NPDC059239]|uniref:TetR/AcrR family transcriptional regulator n=1 Tax=unclassified Nocardia TaxID=2637762 RepID=UPI0036CD1995
MSRNYVHPQPRTEESLPPSGSTGPTASIHSVPSRPGRPRRHIDLDAVANAAEALFAEGGYEAVTIEAVAAALGISRATFYRTVPTKDRLLGIVFERATNELFTDATAVMNCGADAGTVLTSLIRLQIGTAVRLRHNLTVFFGGTDLPTDVVERWHGWSHRYELLWQDAVRDAIDEGFLAKSDLKVTTRLILGMVIWVARWYRPSHLMTPDEIADAAVALISRRLEA